MPTFSEAASQVWREIKAQDGIADEMRDFGAPSECYADAFKGAQTRLVDLLASFGYTAQAFIEELTRRTSARYVYFSPFKVVMDLEAVPQ